MRVVPIEVQHLQTSYLMAKRLFHGRTQHHDQLGSGYFFQVVGLKDDTVRLFRHSTLPKQPTVRSESGGTGRGGGHGLD